MAELVYFTESHTELAKQIRETPDLAKIVNNSGATDIMEVLGHVCAYCNIVVDGYYSQQEIDALIEELVLILRDKNKVIG